MLGALFKAGLAVSNHAEYLIIAWVKTYNLPPTFRRRNELHHSLAR